MVRLTVETFAGELLTVECSAEVAAELARPEPPAKEVTFTDLAGRRRGDDDERIGFLSAALESYYRHGGRLRLGDVSPWEGPRLSFRRLVGEGAIWDGPASEVTPCPFCGGRPLEPYEACLGCCRTGRDLEIPGPSREELRRCAAAERARHAGAELAGGRGPKRLR